MQKNSVADVLRALATGDKSRSETARLRDVFGEVEAALSAGVSRAAVLEALHGQGFTLTLKSFESALYRIRQQRERVGQRPASAAPLSSREPVPEGSAPEETSPDVDDLSGLDKKQRRERLGDQFIKNEPTNPLLKRLQEQKK